MKTIFLYLLLFAMQFRMMAQDSLALHIQEENTHRFKYTQLIAPAAFIGIGMIGLESDWLKYQNKEIRDELQENIDRKITLDDFSQYAPAAAVYGLNLCGVKGKHNFRDRTMILLTSSILMGSSTLILKSVSKVERPDGSTKNSWPSGHTATAFMGAEFLRREYWDVSPWIGVSGYIVAAGTGFFRIYNNRHWLTDVIAGAGIGILSTEISYWIYPYIRKVIFKNKRCKNIALSPFTSLENSELAFGGCVKIQF